MKIFVYNYREFDEAEYFQKFSAEYGVELGICHEAPCLENAHLAEGYGYISIITTKIDRQLMERFHEMGVKMISTRTVGYDHIDLEAAKDFGIKIDNVSYSPECVADYTIMLMLMSIRKMKRIIQREEINDFSLPGIQGRELHNLTVGVIGTGRIGRAVMRNLKGFGCRLYAYDLYQNEETKRFGEYLELEELFARCDMISLHLPLTKENRHMINDKAISKMRDGVVLINTARGSLIDTQALLYGLESGKIGAAAMDVIEHESGMYYYDRKSDVISKRELYILRGFPNVIVTPHMAFYTDQAVSDMVRGSIESCWKYEREEA